MPWKGGSTAEILGVGMTVYGGVANAVVLLNWWCCWCGGRWFGSKCGYGGSYGLAVRHEEEGDEM